MSMSINFRKATRDDLPAIVEMLADDPLGRKREHYTKPLPDSYLNAFDKIVFGGNRASAIHPLFEV